MLSASAAAAAEATRVLDAVSSAASPASEAGRTGPTVDFGRPISETAGWRGGQGCGRTPATQTIPATVHEAPLHPSTGS